MCKLKFLMNLIHSSTFFDTDLFQIIDYLQHGGRGVKRIKCLIYDMKGQ